MRFFDKKTVILLVAVLTVFLLATSAARGKYQFLWMENLVTLTLSPFERTLSWAGTTVRSWFEAVGHVAMVYRENEQLRTEIEELRQQDINTNEVLAENLRLQAILNYKAGATQFDFVVAKVIGRDPSTWSEAIVINRGSAEGIEKNMTVVTPQGLVGTVSQVFTHTAKIQLLLDSRSAVGAIVQRPESRVAGIVEGNGINHIAPHMINLARDADVVEGDVIVTSGLGGIYPKGIHVGEVLEVINDEGGLLKYAVLKPAVDFNRLEEVMVIVRSREPAPLPYVPAKPQINQQTPGAATIPQGAVKP